MSEQPALTTISSHFSQRALFRDGELREAWAHAYPMLFDERDLSIARNQPKYHFLEWLVAICIYHAYGYLSLVEQYEFPSHRRKRNVIERILPEATRRLLVDKGGRPRVQCPDLLAYRPDFKDWFFCEVKGPGDRIRGIQKRFFDQLGAETGRPVRVVRVVMDGRRRAG